LNCDLKYIIASWAEGKFHGKIVNTRGVKLFKNKSIRQKRRSVGPDEKFIEKTNNEKAYITSSELHPSLRLCSNHDDMQDSKGLLAASLNRNY
jgi:hypothetical protein